MRYCYILLQQQGNAKIPLYYFNLYFSSLAVSFKHVRFIMQVDGLGGYYDGLGSIVLSANGMFNTPNKSAVLLEKGHKSMFWKKSFFSVF